MTLILDLTPEEEARLKTEAERSGVNMEDYARQRLGLTLSPNPAAPVEDKTLELFAQWAEEDAKMTPQEVKQAEADWEEFKNNINKWRAESGEEPMFP